MKGLTTFYLNDLFKYAVVVSRFIGLIAFMPGLGEAYVPNRIKVLLALALSVAITPLIEAQFPPLPTEPLGMAVALLGEILVGFFLATVVRMIIAAFDIAGTLIGFQMGLTNVFTASVASGQQSAIIGAFLGACATMILFVTDLHFLILGTLVDSYNLWKPAALPNVNLISEDLFNLVMTVLGKSFWLGLQLSGPIILVSLLITLAGGLINRLIPQFQVFFVLQPLQIATGLMVVYLTLEVAMRLMYGTVEDIFTSFWTGGHA